MHISRRNLRPDRWARLARVANEKGRCDVIVEALKKEGVVEIGDVRVGREVMWGPLLMGMRAGWEAGLVLERARRLAVEVWDLLEEDAEQRRRRDNVKDVVRVGSSERPEVVAVPLGLAAISALAQSKKGGSETLEEEMKMVRLYTRRLMASWRHLELPGPSTRAALQDQSQSTRKEQSRRMDELNYTLQLLTPIHFAIQKALALLNSSVAARKENQEEVKWLTHVQGDVKSMVEEAREELVKSDSQTAEGRRGMVWYKKLVADQA